MIEEERSQAIEAVKKAETKYYEDTADDMRDAGRTFLSIDLINLRAARAYSYADELADDPLRNVTHSGLVNFLVASEQKEFDLVEQQRAHEQEVKTQYLAQLEEFDKQSVNIGMIQKLLLGLSEKQQPMEAAKLLTNLIQNAQKDLDELKKKGAGQ